MDAVMQHFVVKDVLQTAPYWLDDKIVCDLTFDDKVKVTLPAFIALSPLDNEAIFENWPELRRAA